MTQTNLTAEQKGWGVVSYLWILSLVALAARKNDDFIRFHANQGVFLFICWLVGLLTGPFMLVINLIILVAAVIGIIKAWQGEKWELPGVGQYAMKLGDWIVKTFKL